MLKRLRIQRSIVSSLLVALLLLAGCGGSSSPSAGNQAPAPAAPGSANAGQVSISGALSKNFTPIRVEASKVGSKILIFLTEKSADGVSLTFPPDTQPGTYPIEDNLNQLLVDVSGEYDMLSNNAAIYPSTKGSLKLTAVGSKFSGEFQFTAGNKKNHSETIEVTGSFTDVPLS